MSIRNSLASQSRAPGIGKLLCSGCGTPPHGLCSFPRLDSIDRDSMLARSLRRVNPVGVWRVTEGGRRRATVFTPAWRVEQASSGPSVSGKKGRK